MANYDNVPSNLKPISAWGYVGYQLLFSLPIAGFILLIVFAVSDSNINRRNFARSYFCMWLIAAIIGLVVFGLCLALGLSLGSISSSTYTM